MSEDVQHENELSIMSFLPENVDSRPVTMIVVVEDYEKCPKNYTAIQHTYDQDSDADLWREKNIFGKQTTRYLCMTKITSDYVIESLQVMPEKHQSPKQYSTLMRTADSEQKALRKRQIAYKLAKRGTINQAVTDIILCSKLKAAPEGFRLAGDINGILVCYKTGFIPIYTTENISETICNKISNGDEIVRSMNHINLEEKATPISSIQHDYEEVQLPNKIDKTQYKRSFTMHGTFPNQATLGAYTELDGVPLVINPLLVHYNRDVCLMKPLSDDLNKIIMDYDFHLEREILCTMKSSTSNNPFFK